MPGTLACCPGKSGRINAFDSRSRQYRNDAGPPDPRALYRPYHLGCARDRLWRACRDRRGKWPGGRRGAHPVGLDGLAKARRDERPLSSGETRVTPSGVGFLSLMLAPLLVSVPAAAQKYKRVDI